MSDERVTDSPSPARDVSIRATGGSCDAASTHPATGSHPAVLVRPDKAGRV